MHLRALSFKPIAHTLPNIILSCSTFSENISLIKTNISWIYTLESLNITGHLVHFSLEYISKSAHAHREMIILEFTKFSNYRCHVLTSS